MVASITDWGRRLQRGVSSRPAGRPRQRLAGAPPAEPRAAPAAPGTNSTPSTPRMAARRAAALAESEGYALAVAVPAPTVYTPLTTPRPTAAVAVAAGLLRPSVAPRWESQIHVPDEGGSESMTQQAEVLARSPSPQPFVMDLTDIRWVCDENLSIVRRMPPFVARNAL